jgi:hypothetical protein
MNEEQISDHDKEVVNENILPAEQADTQEETMESTEPKTRNAKLQTEIKKSEIEMEVHAHPHHAMHKKKWTEYALDFLMIFLAVTLGFFAEQMREDFADRDREKEYMNSMIEDLKADTASLAANIRLRQQRDEMIDSLVLLLSSPRIKENGNTIYFFGRLISPPIYFFPDDRTIQQLKSTGSLRLIRNMKVSNSIMDYDRKMRQQIFEYTDEQQSRSEYRQIASKIFDGKVFNEMIRDGEIKRPVNDPQLFDNDSAFLHNCIVTAQYERKANQNQTIRAEELFTQAKELMALIKNEYRLEND